MCGGPRVSFNNIRSARERSDLDSISEKTPIPWLERSGPRDSNRAAPRQAVWGLRRWTPDRRVQDDLVRGSAETETVVRKDSRIPPDSNRNHSCSIRGDRGSELDIGDIAHA